MEVTQFISLVRQAAQLPDTSEDVTDAYILRQATLGLYEKFSLSTVVQRAGVWLHKVRFQMVPGQSQYPIPARSLVQGMERVEVAIGGDTAGNGRYRALSVLTTPQSVDYADDQRTGQVYFFTFTGACVEVFPTPSSGQWAQILYYLRPPTLALSSSFPVTAITNPSAGVYRLTIANTALLTQSTLDAQYSVANSEIICPNLPFTIISGTVVEVNLTQNQAAQFSTSTVLNNPEVSSYIMLPQELVNALVAYTVALVLSSIGDTTKAAVFSEKASTNLKNILDLQLPRSKSQLPVFRTRNTYLRQRIGWGGGRGGWG